MGRSKSHLPGCASCLRHLATRCGGLRWAGAKATRRGDLRPAAASGDALRRPTMGRGKSHLLGCAPASGSVYRPAAAFCDGQGQKPPAGACFLPAASGDALRRPTMGRGKSHLLGCAPASGSVYRPAAPPYDGQEQKRRAGVRSGLRHRLPTRCGVLRRAGAKATCRGDLRPAAPSADRLRLSAMGRSKSDAPGCAPACCGIWRRAAAFYDGQEQKRRAGVISGL